AVAIVCGLGPLHAPNAFPDLSLPQRAAFAIARRAPWLALPIFHRMRWHVATRPQNVIERLIARVPAPDAAVLRQATVANALLDSFREAFRKGVRGAARDFKLYCAHWGFDAKQIAAPISVWHG